MQDTRWLLSTCTGPLAASTITGALIRAAFSGVMTSAQRGGNQQVDIQFQQLLVGDLVAAGEPGQRTFVVQRVTQSFFDIEPRRPIKSAAHIADGHDLALGFVQKLGRVRADVAEALNGHAGLRRFACQAAEQLNDHDSHAAAGGFFAPRQAVQARPACRSRRPG